jgi:hypothetical protein
MAIGFWRWIENFLGFLWNSMLTEGRRGFPALHPFKPVQTETVRLLRTNKTLTN